MSDSPVFEMLYGEDEKDIPAFTELPLGHKDAIPAVIEEEEEYPRAYYHGREIAKTIEHPENPYSMMYELKKYCWFAAGVADTKAEMKNAN